MNDERHPLERLTHSTSALGLSFAWGFAEATFFFIVPDVLLTTLGCRSVRASFKACGAAILGALLGGVVMYALGYRTPDNAREILARIPAIHPQLIEKVQVQLSGHGPGALVLGAFTGTPYKIYAVEWGVRHGSVTVFLLASILARGLRFLLSALLANGIARLLARWTGHGAQIELIILGFFWVGFYTFYFVYLGW